MRFKTLLLLALAPLAGCAISAPSGQVVGHSVGGGVETVRDGFGSAVAAPLEDFNLIRKEIPTVLLQARGHPYDVRNMSQCRAIAAEIARLDEALGPDADEPVTDGRLTSERAADAAADTTLDAIRDTTTDLIPGRSWIRRLSGAAQHSTEVRASIAAGMMRRSFLKGVGMQRNCAPPAAPRGFTPR